MIGIDTNILLRLATGDDARQVKKITQWLSTHAPSVPLHINQIVLAEALWTLKSSYGYDREHMVTFVEALLGNAAFDIEDATVVEDALNMFVSSKADFPDCLIFAKNNGLCESTITFDRAASALPGFVDMN
jgi:predicted nucleic-acid-binding protein